MESLKARGDRKRDDIVDLNGMKTHNQFEKDVIKDSCYFNGFFFTGDKTNKMDHSTKYKIAFEREVSIS